MLFGEPPFYSEELSLTYCKILNHAETLDIPTNDDLTQDVSDEARDLIRKLITNKEERLGRNGIEELKVHPFFNEINWDSIESSTLLKLNHLLYFQLNHPTIPPFRDLLTPPISTMLILKRSPGATSHSIKISIRHSRLSI